MQRGNRGFYRGTRGKDSFRSGRGDNRTYSGSSGSSGEQNNHNRPILRLSFVTARDATPPDYLSHHPARVDSLVTPVKEQSSFNMNGHTIIKTYTPSRSSISSPSRPHVSPTSAQQNCSGSIPDRPPMMQRPVTKNGDMNWAHRQEYTIRVLRLPKTCWAREVCEIMSRHGNVVRVEIRQGTAERSALVTFQ
jgi:RNA-dependent RNA polymerase